MSDAEKITQIWIAFQKLTKTREWAELQIFNDYSGEIVEDDVQLVSFDSAENAAKKIESFIEQADTGPDGAGR